MALDREISRLAKILVDSENISFDEAQAKLRALTMEIAVGPEAVSSAAHAAILTAASVGSKTFVGGVRVTGATDGPVSSALPLGARTVGEAAILAGASGFEGRPSRRISVGASTASNENGTVAPWWNGWEAGTARAGEACWGAGDNPLSGIAAGALAVGAVFEAERGRCGEIQREMNLWPNAGGGAPDFRGVFLPGALWVVGLGNLGQALLWALAALPYEEPADVLLVIQDSEKVTEENWATSVLVKTETYGILKAKVAEDWAENRGFELRRLDRRLLASDRLDHGEPRLALSGVDSIASRKLMAAVGFDCIVDAGLGRTASDFDKYRVSVFDRVRGIDEHFAGQEDETTAERVAHGEAYRRLASEVEPCGLAQLRGAAVAAPYVSAVAASVAVSRAIAVASDCSCPISEVGRVSASIVQRVGPVRRMETRGIRRSGKPNCGPVY